MSRENETGRAPAHSAGAESVRAWRVSEARHSGEMEGLTITPASRDDADDYVAGRIGSDELVQRARERYGLD